MHKMKKTSFIFLMSVLFCSCLATNGYSFSINSDNKQIAVGSYKTTSFGDELPLILANNGTDWSYVKHIANLPNDISMAKLSGVACSGNNCTAVGEYWIYSKIYAPLLLSSRDAGKSWSFVKDIQHLPDLKHGEISQVKCYDSICIGVGNYRISNDAPNLPLVLLSNNGGAAWSFVENIYDLPPDLKHASLTSFACSNGICSAVGYYNLGKLDKPDSRIPFLLVSNNSGQSWQFVQHYTIADLPANLHYGAFTDIACNKEQCSISGYYHDTNPYLTEPLILTSNNNGLAWRFAANLPKNTNAFVSKTGCSDEGCVVVGQNYLPKETGERPWIAIGNKANANWSILSNQDIEKFPSFLNNGRLSQIKCATDLCVIAGVFGTQTNSPLPIVLVSLDGGKTWTFKQNIFELPTYLSTLGFNSTDCYQQQCIAAGYYQVRGEPHINPLLIYSANNGQTWELIKNIRNMPTYSYATLNSTTNIN